jgi:drug/metabolite transporter (DMT)-like permease
MLGILVLDNRLGPATLLGGILIAGAVLLIQWNSARIAATV